MKSSQPASIFFAAFLSALFPLALLAQDANTVITSDGDAEMISVGNETTITFHDKVLVVGTDLKLSCDFLKVIVRRKGEATATLGHIENFLSLLATGNVVLIQGVGGAACGRAEVLPEQDRVILTENPVVVDHDQKTRIAGEKITLLKDKQQVLVEKPSLVGPPVKDLGYDKAKKPATPPATETKQP